MKLTQLPRLAFMLGLIGIANISCAADPIKSSATPSATTSPTAPTPATGSTPTDTYSKNPSEPLPPQAVSFKLNREGNLVPINKEGREFASCGTMEQNTCAPFKDKVTLTNMQFTAIAKMDYKINPTCQLYLVIVNGHSIVYYDPLDPNCPKFNR